MWLFEIFIKQFCLVLGFSIVWYILWRIANPGKSF